MANVKAQILIYISIPIAATILCRPEKYEFFILSDFP